MTPFYMILIIVGVIVGVIIYVMGAVHYENKYLMSEPTVKQITSVCYSMRHDYGLLSEQEQSILFNRAHQYWCAIQKEIVSPSKHPYVTADAAKRELSNKSAGESS